MDSNSTPDTGDKMAKKSQKTDRQDTMQQVTMLNKHGVKKRMRCSNRMAARIDHAFITVEQLVDAIESDDQLTNYNGVGKKTATIINKWWEERFEREEKMSSGSVEKTGANTATIHFHSSWRSAIETDSEEGGSK